MKIGLLSMQRVYNYGSFWQAYCLKKMLTNLGHDVEFIDIIPGKKLHTQSYKHSFSLRKLKRIPYYIFQDKRGKIFNKFQIQKLGCNEKKNYSNDYDGILIGSDEVFNFIQNSPWGYSTQLYGGIHNPNVCSYAGSFGYSTYNDVLEFKLSNSMRYALQNLKNISVRDSNSLEIISRLLPDRTIYRHLDPVLIGDLPIPERNEVNEKYMIVYAYDFRFKDKEYISVIKEYAKKMNLKIFSVGFYQDWVDKNIVTDPYELLKFFRNAEYIVTDTFHGTIFSIRCMKKFVTVVRDTNLQKLSSLLENVKLTDRILRNSTDFTSVIEREIDYSSVMKILEKERKRSEVYIEACIKGVAYTDE